MTSLAYFPLGLALAMTAGWLVRSYSLIEALRYMPKIQPRPLQGHHPHQPLISVVVPAKNEEKNIRTCIESLLAQDYSHVEIIVINDNSTDRTQSILAELIRVYGRVGDSPLRTINNTTPTPEGWTGKNFAIHTGISHAQGDWLLFTDADTCHEKTSLSSSLHQMQSQNLELLTLLPRCLAGSFFERLIQPAAMCFLGLWFPIRAINDPNSPVYFANGQYLMMSRSLYEKTGGHAAVRSEFLEDFAFCKKAKALKAKVQCALGEAIYGTRMYDSFDAIWRGWRRIYQHSFGSQPLLLAFRTLSVLFLSVGPFILFFSLLALGKISTPAGLISAGLVFFILAVSWAGYGIVRAPRRFVFLHPLATFFIALILADAAWMALMRRKTIWR